MPALFTPACLLSYVFIELDHQCFFFSTQAAPRSDTIRTAQEDANAGLAATALRIRPRRKKDNNKKAETLRPLLFLICKKQISIIQ